MRDERSLSALELIARPQLWASRDLPFMPFSDSAGDLALYMEQLLAWNRKFNLAAIRNEHELLRDLIQDSFYLAQLIEEICSRKGWKDPEIADLGAGAGLPGIPLRLLWQRGNYTMVEARQKRALFLANMLARLNLPDTQVFEGRAEDYLDRCDIWPQLILSRAFMPWEQLLTFCGKRLSADAEIIIMANEEPPVSFKEWKLMAGREYDTGEKKRWLWSIGRP